jgi:hypothetical protein
MSCPFGDKKGRSAGSSDLTRLHRETADLAAYITYTKLDDNTKLKEQISADSNFSLTRGGLTLLANSTIGFTLNPVTGAIVYPPPGPPPPPPPGPLLWVAGAISENILAYSSDGIIWEQSANGNSIFTYIWDIAWNGTIWVAAGGPGSVRLGYSYDGITWTESANGNSILDIVYGVAWGGGMWVACGRNGISVRLGYSYDGITWTASPYEDTRFNAVIISVAWGGGVWVAGGGGIIKVLYSYDGIIWNSGTLSGGSTVYDMAWNGTLFLGAGGSYTPSVPGKRIIYSSNGINWTGSTNANSIFSTVWAVAWGGGKWVAGGEGVNTLGYSSDGITWYASENGNSLISVVHTVAWEETASRWVAGGAGINNLIFSADGISWTPSANGNSTLGTVYAVVSK